MPAPSILLSRFARVVRLCAPAVFLFLISSPGRADLLIERQRGGPMQYNGGPGDPKAAFFDLAEATRIQTIYGWLRGEGDVTISISADSLDHAFSQSFALEPVGIGPAEWQGISSLRWDLAPGTYQITFSGGFLPYAYGGPPSTAPDHPYDYMEYLNGTWQSTAPFGVQIHGRLLSAVPEPATFGLIGAALLLVFAAGRARRVARPGPLFPA